MMNKTDKPMKSVPKQSKSQGNKKKKTSRDDSSSASRHRKPSHQIFTPNNEEGKSTTGAELLSVSEGAENGEHLREEVVDIYSLEADQRGPGGISLNVSEDKVRQVKEFMADRNEVLRWGFRLEDPELEAIRMDLYKVNRRKRYIAQAQRAGFSWARARSLDSSCAPESIVNRGGPRRLSQPTINGPYASKADLEKCYTVQEVIRDGLVDRKDIFSGRES